MTLSDHTPSTTSTTTVPAAAN